MNVLTTVCILGALVLTAHAVCKTSGVTAFEQAALDKHNAYRKLHTDTPDLCYGESGDDITFSAQTWATKIAGDKKMSHSTGSYGENIAYGATSGTARAEDAAYEYSTLKWYEEIKNWSYETSASTGGVTGHFTQVVWKNSKQLNCGYATYTTDSALNAYMAVCQYYPPGNYANKYPANVLALDTTDDDNNTDDDNTTDDDNKTDADETDDDNNTDDKTDTDNDKSDTDDSASASLFNSTLVLGLVSAAIMRLALA